MDTISKQSILRFGLYAVALNIFGIIFSGLVFPVVSLIFYPQPSWQGPDAFIQAFHPMQTATYFCGFFLVIGSLLTFIALYLTSSAGKKVWALSGLAINLVFTAVVFLNYVIQTTYIPYLATNNPPEASIVLAVFTMANPASLAWALEMYGWGGIGLSFIFMAMIFSSDRPGRTLKVLFLLNGISSCAAAVMTSIDMHWLFSTAGLISLVVWNVLVLIIDLLLLRHFSRKDLPV